MVWDPFDSYDEKKLMENEISFRQKLTKITRNPKKPKNDLTRLIIILTLIVLSLSILIPAFLTPNISLYDIKTYSIMGSIIFFIIGLILSFLLVLWKYTQYLNLAKNYVNSEIAKRNNWHYLFDRDYGKGLKLTNQYPEVFNSGSRRYVENQFWGDDSNPFYAANYSYLYSTHNRYYYHFNLFSFPLKTNINLRFNLSKENIFNKMGNFFTKKEINTGSTEFDKLFSISYKGKKSENSTRIKNFLTPRIQQKLLDLAKTNDIYKILFANDKVFFVFNNKLMPKIKTNLFKSNNLASEDLNFITSKFRELLEFSKDIQKI